jgi:hypothetical protein
MKHLAVALRLHIITSTEVLRQIECRRAGVKLCGRADYS